MDPRRYRGRTQSIFLVNLEVLSTSLKFHILGTTHHMYIVTLPRGKQPSCSCPDHTIRGNVCKHIYFVCDKVINLPYFDWTEVQDICAFADEITDRLPHLKDEHVVADDYYTKTYKAYLQGKEVEDDEDEKEGKEAKGKLKLRNEECCVCFGDFDESDKKNIMVCPTCLNGIHTLCWKKWTQVNHNNKCVYCRSGIQKQSSAENERKGKHAKVILDSEWGILLV